MMLAHRASQSPEMPRSATPTPDEIAAFADLLLSPEGDDTDGRIAHLLAGGLSVDSLLLDLLAPSARHLGLLWEEDLCDFTELTIAMGRLQRISYGLSSRFGGEEDGGWDGRSLLLLTCPGETHSFGVTLLDRFFRKAGWDTVCATEASGVDPVSLVRTEWFDVVGLSLACETLLPVLAETIEALRGASRNPDLHIMVGGPIFLDHPEYVFRVGADATARDARQAIAIAQRLLDLRARAC
ncbi:MAG: cobalamin B12-binding domain-containing protein [Methylobacterium sp.]|nr:cobalamin B12-binding domain-containing protein [Methylobacterium sp.]